jgi:hypothetical protein
MAILGRKSGPPREQIMRLFMLSDRRYGILPQAGMHVNPVVVCARRSNTHFREAARPQFAVSKHLVQEKPHV